MNKFCGNVLHVSYIRDSWEDGEEPQRYEYQVQEPGQRPELGYEYQEQEPV